MVQFDVHEQCLVNNTPVLSLSVTYYAIVDDIDDTVISHDNAICG